MSFVKGFELGTRPRAAAPRALQRVQRRVLQQPEPDADQRRLRQGDEPEQPAAELPDRDEDRLLGSHGAIARPGRTELLPAVSDSHRQEPEQEVTRSGERTGSGEAQSEVARPRGTKISVRPPCCTDTSLERRSMLTSVLESSWRVHSRWFLLSTAAVSLATGCGEHGVDGAARRRAFARTERHAVQPGPKVVHGWSVQTMATFADGHTSYGGNTRTVTRIRFERMAAAGRSSSAAGGICAPVTPPARARPTLPSRLGPA